MNRILTVLTTLFLSSCSDYKISKIVETSEPGIEIPEIEVTPITHDFGPVSAGSQTLQIEVIIKNIGNGDLDVSNISLENNNSNFSIVPGQTFIISPMTDKEVLVSYSPRTYETNSDKLVIESNDEDEPVVKIDLDGSGDAPVIDVVPPDATMGTIFIGCDDYLDVRIGNIGNSDLIISDLEYFSSMPPDFIMEEYEDLYGPVPITISPGVYIDIQIGYFPLDLHDDNAYIEITSNDPATPIEYANQDGTGDYEGWLSETFTQDETVAVDILFVVDNSGSMGGNQTNLQNNFDTFMNAFTAAGVSYQIALITTDSGDFVGDIITNATADPVVEFNNQINSIGTRGSASETGLWFAYESTTSGDASASSSTGFFRSSARLVVVYVSDEKDWSTYRSSMTPAEYSASLLSLKASSSLVIAHAIAGDHPSGCSANGGATFGDGYYDVVTTLGGTFMSICASDWSTTMDTLARDSISMTDFPLSEIPVEESIIVQVSGIPSSDWIYNSSSNSIAFTVVPGEGSTIEISYATWACQ